MSTTLPCPVCHTALTVVSAPGKLACPFCRAPIRFANGHVPMGKRVRCGKCSGVFTAERPPPVLFVYTSTSERCPHCDVKLKLPQTDPPTRKFRCPRCQETFIPGQEQSLPQTTYAHTPPGSAPATFLGMRRG